MNTNNKHEHYDVIIAFANGAQIEGRPTPNSAWTLFSNPSWENNWEYRVKPEENETWKPKDGEIYYFLGSTGAVKEEYFRHDWPDDKAHIELGNYFPSKKKAKAAIPRIKALLKGTTDVSANVGSNVGSKDAEIKALKEELETLKLKISAPSRKNFQLDGKPLTDGEVALIKAMRDYPIEGIFWKKDSILVCKDDMGILQPKFSHISLWSSRTVVSKDHPLITALGQIQAEQEANDANTEIG